MLELQKAIMIEVTQILKNKLCMLSFFLFYWLFGSFKLCTPILLTFWPPIFHTLPSSLPPAHKRKQVKASKEKKRKQKENTKQKNHFASSPFSLPLQHLFVHSGGIGGFSVPYSIYFFVPSVFLANVHCNELLFWFKAFSFWYTINTKSSSKLLWMFCGWALEIFLVSRGHEYRGADFRGGWPQGPELTSLATS